jgi:hypothetical protein
MNPYPPALERAVLQAIISRFLEATKNEDYDAWARKHGHEKRWTE